MTVEDKIIELFWYSSEERKLFAYIDTYMSALENWFGENRMNDAQLVRYMLVGLFLEYRAANHRGEDFNTNIYEWNTLYLKPKTIQKHKTINKYLGHPIDTTDEYLKQLQTKDVSSFTKRLFDFVIYGKYL